MANRFDVCVRRVNPPEADVADLRRFIDEVGDEVLGTQAYLSSTEKSLNDLRAKLQEMGVPAEVTPTVKSDTRGQLQVFPDRRPLLELGRKADVSTVNHEMAHAYLDMLDRMSKGAFGAEAQAWAEKQLGDIKEMTGFKRVAPLFHTADTLYLEPDKQVGELTTEGIEIHETFAEMFETYLRSGKTNNVSQKKAMRNYRRWMTSIYRSADDPRISRAKDLMNDEVTDWFDRMIEAEDHSAAAAAELDVMADERVKAMVAKGILTEKQAKNVAKRLIEARERATEEMLAKLTREHEARLTQEAERIRRRVRRESTEEFDTSKTGRAMNWLTDGEWNGNKLGQQGERDRLARAEAMGFDTLEMLYHRTSVDFDEFRVDPDGPSGPAIYLGPDPQRLANAHNRRKEGDRIMPVYIRYEWLLPVTLGTRKQYADKYMKGSSEFPWLVTQEAVDLMKADGFDGIKFEMETDTESSTEYVIFDPKNVRGAFARFEDANTSNILGQKELAREARYKRMEDMGYDTSTVLYRGVRSDPSVRGPDQALFEYYTDSPFYASYYAFGEPTGSPLSMDLESDLLFEESIPQMQKRLEEWKAANYQPVIDQLERLRGPDREFEDDIAQLRRQYNDMLKDMRRTENLANAYPDELTDLKDRVQILALTEAGREGRPIDQVANDRMMSRPLLDEVLPKYSMPEEEVQRYSVEPLPFALSTFPSIDLLDRFAQSTRVAKDDFLFIMGEFARSGLPVFRWNNTAKQIEIVDNVVSFGASNIVAASPAVPPVWSMREQALIEYRNEEIILHPDQLLPDERQAFDRLQGQARERWKEFENRTHNIRAITEGYEQLNEQLFELSWDLRAVFDTSQAGDPALYPVFLKRGKPLWVSDETAIMQLGYDEKAVAALKEQGYTHAIWHPEYEEGDDDVELGSMAKYRYGAEVVIFDQDAVISIFDPALPAGDPVANIVKQNGVTLDEDGKVELTHTQTVLRNAAIERADQMGFDTATVYYHGSPVSTITEFRPSGRGAMGPGVYMSDVSAYAQQYAGRRGTLYPLYVRGAIIDDEELDAMLSEPAMLREFSDRVDALSDAGEFTYNTYEKVKSEMARDMGFAGRKQRGGFVGPDGDISFRVIVFEPENIRSIFAAFNDPATANILGQQDKSPIERLEDRAPPRKTKAGAKTVVAGVVERFTVENNSATAPKMVQGSSLITKTTNATNAAKQSEALDALLVRHRTPLNSLEEWVAYGNDAFSNTRVPMPPWRTLAIVKEGSAAVERELGTLSDGMRRDAEAGLQTAKEFGELYASGQVDPIITLKAFYWSMLSRRITPYFQESAFLDTISDPEFNAMLTEGLERGWSDDLAVRFQNWASQAIPKGSGGRSAILNLNAFGDFFLPVMMQKENGKTHVEIIHDMLASGVPSHIIRREFLRLGAGSGIDNKVFSFMMLLVGRTDVLILDRVQIRNQFNDGRFGDENLYDNLKDENGKALTGTGLQEFGKGHIGLFFYEAMERALKPIVEQAYANMGMEGSLGRYHWDSWLAASDQEVGHASVEGLFREAQGAAAPYVGAYVRQGKYGSYDYGFRYTVMEDGKPAILVEMLQPVTDADAPTAYLLPHSVMADSKSPTRKALSKLSSKARKRGTEFGTARPWHDALTEEERNEYDEAIKSGGTAAPIDWANPTDAAGPQTENILGQDGVGPERTGDGRRQPRIPRLARLEGAPAVPNFAGPIPEIVAVADEYARANGIPVGRQAAFAGVDVDLAQRIAQAYEEMKHDPQDPETAAAYQALIEQTKAQYDALVAAGYSFTFFDRHSDPYEGNPWNAMRDLRATKTMAVFATSDGYGTEGITDSDIADNPMLEDSGLTWPDQAGVQQPVTYNDIFRAVHDAMGHGLEGSGFRARGEENAWQAHVQLYFGGAVAAMTSETRGQNSWLNYGPYGEQNRTASLEDTIFAEQKIGLLPSWAWTEGRQPFIEETAQEQAEEYPFVQEPKKKVKAYKLFRLDPKRPGELFPLFVQSKTPVPMGRWIGATSGVMDAQGRVKSSIGALKYRPGWHAGDVPAAPHIGAKLSSQSKGPDTRRPDQVWAEVELGDDVDWQSEANAGARRNKAGKIIASTADITDRIPEGGHYRYKTNPNMKGEWLIGGEMRVVRVLPDAEVEAINKEAGTADLPRRQPGQWLFQNNTREDKAMAKAMDMFALKKTPEQIFEATRMMVISPHQKYDHKASWVLVEEDGSVQVWSDGGHRTPRKLRPVLQSGRELKSVLDTTDDDRLAVLVPAGFPDIPWYTTEPLNALQSAAIMVEAMAAGIPMPPDPFGHRPITRLTVERLQEKLGIEGMYLSVSNLANEQQMAGALEPTRERNLYVVHNTRDVALRFQDEMGGFAGPSIAVSRTDVEGFEGFGDISLIASPELLDDKDIHVFNADVYSPRQPKRQIRIEDKAVEAFYERVRTELPDRYQRAPEHVSRFVSKWKTPDGISAIQLHLKHALDDQASMEFLLWGYREGLISKDAAEFRLPEMDKGFDSNIKLLARKAFDIAHRSDAVIQARKPFVAIDNIWELAKDRTSIMQLDDDVFFKKELGWGEAYFDVALVRPLREAYAEETGLDSEKLIPNADYRRFITLAAYYHHIKMHGNIAHMRVRQTVRDALANGTRKKKASDMVNSWLDYIDTQFASIEQQAVVTVGSDANGNPVTKEYTVENVVEAMFLHGIRGGEGAFGGAGYIRGLVAEKLAGKEAVAKARTQIVSMRDFHSLKSFADRAVYLFENEIRNILPKEVRNNREPDDWLNQLLLGELDGVYAPDRNGPLMDLKRRITEMFFRMPTEYFEAKATRPVALQEFVAAVVPNDTKADIIHMLRNAGLQVVKYGNRNTPERITAIRKLQAKNVFFQNGPKYKNWGPIDPPDGLTPVRLSRQDLKNYPKHLVKALPRKIKLRMNDETLPETSVEQAAHMFGFANGTEMLEAFNAVGGDRGKAIANMTNSVMENEYPETQYDKEKLADMAADLANNEVRERQHEIEMIALSEAMGVQPALRLARVAADEALEKMTYNQLAGWRQWRAEADRLENKVAAAINEGEIEQAQRLKARAQLLREMYRKGEKALQRFESKRKEVISYTKGERFKRIVRAGNQYVEHLNGIIDRYRLKPETNRQAISIERFLNWVDRQLLDKDPLKLSDMKLDGVEDGGDPIAMMAELEREQRLRDMAATMRGRSYRTMTLAEMEEVAAQASLVHSLAKTKDRLLTDRKNRTIAKAAADVATQVRRKKGSVAAPSSDPQKGRSEDWARSVLAGQRSLQSIAFEMDGAKSGGVVWNFIVRPLNEAVSRKEEIRQEMMQRIVDALEERFGVSGINQLGKDKIGFRLSDENNTEVTRQMAISILLNAGTAKGRQRLADGRGIKPQDLQRIMELLTLDDVMFVQDLWDIMESYFSDMDAAHRDIHGLPLKKEPPVPLATPFKDENGKQVILAGGYMPLVYDGRQSTATQQRQLNDAAMKEARKTGGSITAKTKVSSQKERADVVTLPVLLDFTSIVVRHVDQVSSEIGLTRALLDVARILTNEDVRRAIVEKYGRQTYDQIVSHIRETKEGPQILTTWEERALSGVRNNMSIMALGANLGTIALQPAGLFQSMSLIGKRQTLKGMLMTYSGNGAKLKETAETAARQSLFMQQRMDTMNREVNDALARMQGRSSVVDKISEYSLVPMQQLQFYMVDLPTWNGAFDLARRRGFDDVDASAIADQAVIDSQGSGQIQSLAGIQRGGLIKKLMTNFLSVMFTIYNLGRAKMANRNHLSFNGFMANLNDLMLLSVLPTVYYMLIQYMRGQLPEDEEEWPTHFNTEMTKYFLSMNPMTNLLGQGLSQFGYSGPAGMAPLGVLGKAVQETGSFTSQAVNRLLTGEEMDDDAMADLLYALGRGFAAARGFPIFQAEKVVETGLATMTGEIEDLPTFGQSMMQGYDFEEGEPG